jgi:nicotinate-nucleotide pyrophosphorylase (carboxylating)
MKKGEVDSIIEAALKEDMPQGDVTSENIIPPASKSKAVILAKGRGVLAGMEVARRVFQKIDPKVRFRKILDDGQTFNKGERLAEVEGSSISLLKGERTALNFLQRMSGIATTTRKFVRAIQGTKTKILDTRKTTPGLRALEKYAVRMGGGLNHRFSLSDMVLIKDNHLRVVPGISEAIKRAKRRAKPGVKVEVEATSMEEVIEAVRGGADMVMLDNMPAGKIKDVVKWVKGRVPLEVSGKVTLAKAKEAASLGVDFVSVGSLTHSYKSVDISIEFLG